MGNLLSNKVALHQQCLQIVEQKIIELKTSLHEMQDAANNETKSTVGDKYETARAMIQLETEKLEGQLNESQKLKQTLLKVNPKAVSDKVMQGSLVITNRGNFYIVVSLGKVVLSEENYLVISPLAPISQLLLSKKERETFSFNGIEYTIQKII